jgi:hypothetical protein
MMRVSSLKWLALAVLATACSESGAPQVVSGRVAVDSFPAGATEVRAMSHGQVVAVSPLDAEGRFSLSLPAGDRYRIVIASEHGAVALVFPRPSGAIDRSVWIEAGGDTREVGRVRYIGNPTTAMFSFAGDCEESTEPDAPICVDEADGDNNQEGIDEADGDNNQCGVDEPDGDNNQEGADGEDATDGDIDEGAVGEENLPEEIGCEGGEEGGDEGGEEGGDEGGEETPPGDEDPPEEDVPVVD